LVSLGLSFCLELLGEKISSRKLSWWTQILLVALMVYGFVQTSHLALARIYDDSPVLKIEAYAEKIKATKNIFPEEVIAVAEEQSAYRLNYMTGKSFVIFRPETLEKLLAEKKLPDVFKQFGVAYIIGYDKELSEKIAKQTKVGVLAENLPPVELELSGFKKQFMNFFR
jgi:hypothetical protein